MAFDPLGLLVLLLVVALPLGWLVSEFRCGLGTRLTLGVLAILCSVGVAFLIVTANRMQLNIWYGDASKQLIDATVSELEAGHTDQVLEALRNLQSEYHPNYSTRDRYDKRVERAVSEMTAGGGI